VLVLDMIEILPPLGKYKYDTWRILPVKCYIDNFVRLRSCKRNVNIGVHRFMKFLPKFRCELGSFVGPDLVGYIMKTMSMFFCTGKI
jgi:hypothetical protein